MGLSLAKHIPTRPTAGNTAEIIDMKESPIVWKQSIPKKRRMEPTFLLAI